MSVVLCTLALKSLAETIDHWFGADINSYSLSGKSWAEKNDWSLLKHVWRSALQEVCGGNTTA